MILQDRNINIAIFASGNGSNACALIHKSILLGHKINCVITDNPNAGIISKCQELNTPCYIIPFVRTSSSYHDDKMRHESKIIEVLKKNSINWIFLAGYMRILGPTLLQAFYNKTNNLTQIINIHPSLLPQFPGKDGYGDAFKANVVYSGITVHFVDQGIDSGCIIAQKKFERTPHDTLQDFKSRGLKVEHELYCQVLENLINNKNINIKDLYELH